MSKVTTLDNHNYSYYMKCFFAGLFPCGLTHTLLTPLDVVKCRRQIYPELYSSLWDGLKKISAEKGIRGLYLGWQPTIIGYSLQGAAKYGLYEIFKDVYAKYFGINNRTLIYMISSASAEIFADTLLCPFESLKVRMQTSFPGTFPEKLKEGFKELSKEGVHGFYKGFIPVICRQIPNTMVKFATYENTVKFIYSHFLLQPKYEYSKFTQLSVTFLSGYVAGVFCCFVSNPADIVVSKLNNVRTDKNEPLMTSVKKIYADVGFTGLWRGFGTRVLIVGTLSALEWLIYDFFKVLAGLETTGGK